MRDDNECHYCGLKLTFKPDRDDSRTRDHIVPRARGGLDVRWNIVWACKVCNVNKADDWPWCRCSICTRTKRRHWEMLKIGDPRKTKKSRDE